MQIVEIKDREVWNAFVIEQSGGLPSSFLQSFEWGEYQERLGRRVFRVAIVDNSESGALKGGKIKNQKSKIKSTVQNSKILAAITLIRMSLPMGRSWLYSPRGPIIKSQISNTKHIYDVLIEKVREIGEEENFVWWRVEPADQESNKSLLRQGFGGQAKNQQINNEEKCELGFRAPQVLKSYQQPRSTLLVDLTLSEEDLLKKMHSKTRYNIRLSHRKGVQIEESRIMNHESRIDDFYSLMQVTGKRDGISVYPREWYETLLKTSGELVCAEYEGEMVAANILIHFGNTTTYLHGVSSSEHRNIMAPQLLQWECIKRAKERGSHWYDFWGIEGKGQVTRNKLQTGKSWAGITRYKRGFVSLDGENPSGKEISYIGAYDLPLSKAWYHLYRVGGAIV